MTLQVLVGASLLLATAACEPGNVASGTRTKLVPTACAAQNTERPCPETEVNSSSVRQAISNAVSQSESVSSPSAVPASKHSSRNVAAPRQPNFLFIMTDDQDLHLNSLDYQPILKSQMTDKGTKFNKHFYVNTPYGGYPKFIDEGLNEKYLPVWLQQAGYNTYYTGKLMNRHGTKTYDNPYAAGWTRSDFLLDPSTYNYLDAVMALDNGPVRSIKGRYSTDVVANRSMEFLTNAIDSKKPWFVGVTPIGPHADSTPNGFDIPVAATRHENLFPDVKAPRVPNFNPNKIGDVSYLKNLPPLNSDQIDYVDLYYRKRLQALQSVDELVGNLIKKLEAHPDVLANTYIIYTSDNGYHLGNHRLPPGKTCNIEEDVNVPFIIRGPGIAAGKEVSFPTSHTDIVPTLFKLAKIPLHENFDGVPMAVTEESQKTTPPTSEHVNIEYWGSGYLEGTAFRNLRGMLGPNTYKTLRIVSQTYEFMYAVWCTNEHQLYDMSKDPYQLSNLYGQSGQAGGFPLNRLTTRLDALLLTLKSCAGRQCREPWLTLFPNGNVKNLQDAMAPTYDKFFANQPNVMFSRCAPGYITEFEGALLPNSFGGPTRRMEDWI